MTEEQKAYSIALRLRRVTYEDAYVEAPATGAIVKANDDGTGSIDVEAVVAKAIRIGQDDRVQWMIEETQVEGSSHSGSPARRSFPFQHILLQTECRKLS